MSRLFKALQQPNGIQSLLAGIEFVWNKITIHEYTVILPINMGQHNLKFVQVCYKSSSTTELLIHSLAYVNLFTALMFFLHVNRRNSSSRGFYAGSYVGFVVKWEIHFDAIEIIIELKQISSANAHQLKHITLLFAH